MTTLQRFKLLAVQCAVADSPSRSPSTSPAFHVRRRRRMTLKKLLKETAGGSRLLRRASRPPDREENAEKRKPDALLAGRTLKDLFVSSPTYDGRGAADSGEAAGGRRIARVEAVPDGRDAGGATIRPIVALRCRLLRRAWRPVLLTIPE
ncbi:unnamed protein product [Victoria cruziana]